MTPPADRAPDIERITAAAPALELLGAARLVIRRLNLASDDGPTALQLLEHVGRLIAGDVGARAVKAESPTSQVIGELMRT